MNSTQRLVAIWAAVAFIVACIMTFNNSSHMVVRAGIFMKIVAILVGTGLGTAGAMLGDALRKFTKPDAFITTGGLASIFRTKLFWMVGPQLIGLLIGVTLGASFVLK